MADRIAPTKMHEVLAQLVASMPARRIGLALAALAALFAVAAIANARSAQPPARVARVAYLDVAFANRPPPELPVFAEQLRELGWVEGENIEIEYIFGDDDYDRLTARARETVERGVDVLVAFGTEASRRAKEVAEPREIPVVASGSDPVGAGLVQSLARPGGNVTGLSSAAPQLAAKRLELLQELAPDVRRVAVLWNPENAGDKGEWDETSAAAPELGVNLISLEVRGKQNFGGAFQLARQQDADALYAFSSSIINNNSELIVKCAAELRLPGIYPLRDFVVHGGLMAYGPPFDERYRRAAVFVDKILKGARPADLPIEKAQRFQLIVNPLAAEDLRLSIPRTLRAQVDEVLAAPTPQPGCPP